MFSTAHAIAINLPTMYVVLPSYTKGMNYKMPSQAIEEP